MSCARREWGSREGTGLTRVRALEVICGYSADTNGNAPDDDPGRYTNRLKFCGYLVAGTHNHLCRTHTEWRSPAKRRRC
jgi:hypothetical protein